MCKCVRGELIGAIYFWLALPPNRSVLVECKVRIDRREIILECTDSQGREVNLRPLLPHNEFPPFFADCTKHGTFEMVRCFLVEKVRGTHDDVRDTPVKIESTIRMF